MSRVKKILVIGNTFFGTQIAEGIQSSTDQFDFHIFDTNKSVRESARYLFHLPSADLVFSVTADLNGGGALKAASLLNKPILQEFVGCDVTQAVSDLAQKKLNKKLVGQSHFICGAPWLVEELAEAGLKSEFVSDYVKGVPSQPVPLPAKFSVLSYVGDYDEDLYGMGSIVECARALPEIPFRIVGIKRSRYAVPPNVHLLGWTDQMALELGNCTVFLRLTRHDGMAHSVIEALGKGRWVIRSTPMPGTIHATTSSEAIPALKRLLLAHQQETLNTNLAGHNYVHRNFSKNSVVNKLVSTITKALTKE